MLRIKFYTFGPYATNYVEWTVETDYVSLSRMWGFYDGGALNICAEGMTAYLFDGHSLNLEPIEK